MEIIWLIPLLNWAEYFGWIYVSCLCVHSLCSGNWRQGHSSSTCKLQGSECFQCGSSERLSLQMSYDRFDTCKPPHLHPPQHAQHTLSDVACDWNHILQENFKPCNLIFSLAIVFTSEIRIVVRLVISIGIFVKVLIKKERRVAVVYPSIFSWFRLDKIALRVHAERLPR